MGESTPTDPYSQLAGVRPRPQIVRVHFTLVASLQQSAWSRMAELGMDFGEYVRHLIREDLKVAKVGRA